MPAKCEMKLLLVDDEQDITIVLKRGLESHGYNVDTYNLPAEVPLQNAKNYDFAILDIQMPEINGFKLAKLLWQHNDRLQVCFMTAFEIFEREARMIMPSLKNFSFIKKPFTSTELAKHLEGHILKH